MAITIVRSGGIAGLTRRWGVTAPPADAEHWRALVEECPWSADDEEDARGERTPSRSSTAGADRFAWTVQATTTDATRRARLSEDEASGPWRTLIDAVRDEAASAAPEE